MPQGVQVDADDSASSSSDGVTNGYAAAKEKNEWSSDDDILATKPGLEWYQATGSLVLAVIGVGVMALPVLPQKGGVVPAVILMLVCGLTITESGIAMWKGIMAANAQVQQVKADCKVSSYEDFGRAALGDAGEAVVVTVMGICMTGICAAYAALISNCCAHLDRALHGDSPPWLDNNGWLWMMYPLFCAISLLPNVTSIQKMVPIAVVCVAGVCSIVIGKSAMDAQRWQAWPDLDRSKMHQLLPDDYGSMGSMVATLFGAFGVNGYTASVLCEMKDPMKFPMAFKTAMLIVGVFYMGVMLIGYYGYGGFMQNDIIASLSSFPANEHEAFEVPYSEWTGPKTAWLSILISAMLFIKLLVGLPLNMVVVFYSVQTCQWTKETFKYGTAANYVFRLCIGMTCVVIAQMVPVFNQLFALVCAIFFPFMQCIFPLLFGYRIRQLVGGGNSSFIRRTFHGFMILVALYTLFVGTANSIMDIVSGHSSGGGH